MYFNATGWTFYTGGVVSLDVPASGTVVVEAQVWLQVNHTNGLDSIVYDGVTSSLITGPAASAQWPSEIDPAAATSYINVGTFSQGEFKVASAGVYHYYIVGENGLNSAGSRFWYGEIQAVYYPS